MQSYPVTTFATVPTSAFTPAQVGSLADIGCEAVRARLGETAYKLCLAGAGLITGSTAGEVGASDTRGASYGGQQFASCPEGYRTDANGMCVRTGVGGFMERVLPGGEAGRLTADYGPATYGMYGVGLVPAQVAIPTLRCPPGMKLGKDDICYQQIARSNRKWNPGTRPLLTGGDVSALSRAARLQKKIRKINSKFGPKVCRTTTKRGKK